MTPEATKPAVTAQADHKKSAAKKPPAKDLNKSAEIRKLAAGIKAKGEKPRPKTIIDMLKKRGITVSSPQVSMVLKKMGFRPRRRRKAVDRATNHAAPGTKKPSKVKIEDLVKAKKVAAQMGGVEKALAALQALKGFE